MANGEKSGNDTNVKIVDNADNDDDDDDDDGGGIDQNNIELQFKGSYTRPQTFPKA